MSARPVHARARSRGPNIIGIHFTGPIVIQYHMSGVRAEVKINSPASCPVASVSDAADAPSTAVSKTVDEETVTEEFMLHTESVPDVDGVDGVDGVNRIEEVFAYNSKRAYRFERPRNQRCPCADIEAHDCPLLETYYTDNSLVMVFHAPDIVRLRDVLLDLKDNWSDVSVHRLIQSGDEHNEDELVLVDRGELTGRQREILEYAHEMGYYDHPKGANATEVADALGITQATFAEHLAAAQQKLMATLLEA